MFMDIYWQLNQELSVLKIILNLLETKNSKWTFFKQTLKWTGTNSYIQDTTHK